MNNSSIVKRGKTSSLWTNKTPPLKNKVDKVILKETFQINILCVIIALVGLGIWIKLVM